MSLFRVATTAFLLLMLSACGSSFMSQEPAQVKQSTNLRNNKPLTVSQIVSMLQKGQEQTAKFALEQLLRGQPNNKLAKKLLNQITVDPIKLYGSNSINYTIKSGDSLGKLAAKYIGDSMDFYGLARYNKIKDPRKIMIGKTIKIPIKAKKVTTSRYQTDLVAAKKLNKPLAIIKVLLSKKSAFSKTELKLFEQEFKRYFAGSDKAPDFAGKRNALKGLSSVKSKSKYKRRLINYADYLDYLIRANEQLKVNENLQAYDIYLKAFNLKQKANSLDTYINGQLTERIHRKAIIYFRDQELERAIHLWDKILKINSHEPSKKYRARATRLTTKLKSLNNE
jgi:tetratricopeptide (TPR) repeat protein